MRPCSSPAPAGAVEQKVYFSVQGGKLKHLGLKTRDAKHQFRYEQRPL